MANYVKFMRGTPEAYMRLLASETKPDDDTLYFISEADSDDVTLYLGSKIIAGSEENLTLSLKSLTDVALKANLLDKDILVYDSLNRKWINSSFEDAVSVFIGATSQTTGKAGLVPAPGLGQTNLFLRSDGTWAAINGVSESNVTIIENDSNLDHNEVIDQVSKDWIVTKGDIIIIKDIIANDLYQHTSFVYNGSNWAAMDGNYNAENVYFNDNFMVTSPIGTITSIPGGSVTLNAKGKNIKQVLTSLLTAKKNPSASQPYASITLTNSGVYEVGRKVTPGWRTSFSPGSYTYGPSTGVTDNGGSVSSSGGDSATISAGNLNGASGTFNEYQVTDNSNYKASLTYGWNAGTTTPVDNLGNLYSAAKINAASGKTANSSGSISGYRAWFKGGLATDSTTPLTSDIIRSLGPSSGSISNTTFELKAASYANCKRIVIAIPAASGKGVTRVDLKSNSNQDITTQFVKQTTTINVNGLNGYTAKPYNVWVYEPDRLDSSEVYTITIS